MVAVIVVRMSAETLLVPYELGAVTSVSYRTSGSVVFRQGNVMVTAVVSGPKQLGSGVAFSPHAHLKCDVKVPHFAKQASFFDPPALPSNQRQSSEEQYLSRLLQDTLEPLIHLEEYPKSLIEIHVSILVAGSQHLLIPAMISAASIALKDSGLKCHDICFGALVWVSRNPGEEEWKTSLEAEPPETEQRFSVIVGVLPNLKQLSFLDVEGDCPCPPDTLFQATQIACQVSLIIFKLLKPSLSRLKQ